MGSNSYPVRLPRPARTGAAYSFPYPTPYSIQLDLMAALFDAIEDKKVAVFESPTGTGKSLSLICATFTWLRENQKRKDAIVLNGDDGRPDDEPLWVRKQAAERLKREMNRHEDELKERIAAVKGSEAKLRSKALREAKMGAATFNKRRRLDEEGVHGDDLSDDDSFLPSEPSSSASTSALPAWHALATSEDDPNLSPAVRALMTQFSGPKSGELEELPETMPKVVYASRTHSQLSQFVSELKKTSFGKDNDDAVSSNAIRTIALGSRKQMCINDQVQKLGARAGTEAMNEACRELASGKDKGKRCKFLPAVDAVGRSQILDFRDRALAEVRDIEDLVEVGKELKTCPYYAARTAARQAELVTLPYNLLLQKTARESLGISFENSVILIDESHNLIDTILGVYSCTITSAQLTMAKGQIAEYLRRFASRLKGESEMHLRTLRRLLEGLDNVVSKWGEGRGTGKEEVWTAAKVIDAMGGNLDTVNLGRLEIFLKETHIARKVSGYAEKAARRKELGKDGLNTNGKAQHCLLPTATPLPPSAIAAMHNIESFIISLSNRTQDGRVLLSVLPASDSNRSIANESGTSPIVSLKYQLLNPSEAFADLVADSRAIIMAGGTMEPIADIRKQLLPTLRPDRWSTFSCGHIVPTENLFCSIVPSGPRGIPFDFTYAKRGDGALLDDLGNAIANFAALIPHGIVVFLPSYKLLDEVVVRWKNTGAWKRLESRKAMFTEPKQASEVDVTLQAYATAIDHAKASSTTTGSLLLAVVGAKLSEGINFSDRLARAVVMVGMPFPNSQSPEVMERMKYVRALSSKSTSSTSSSSSTLPREDPGQALYLSLCLKAVNQSIGRAIRHQGDFASLLLLDARYARREIRNGLPGWIREEVKVQEGFGSTMKDLGAWWRKKRAEGLA